MNLQTTPWAASRYIQDSISTASPGRLVVMLYDRLALDLARAAEALGRGDRASAHPLLLHAQDIVAELASSLDHSAGWSGSQSLGSLYTWLIAELVRANIKGDPERVNGCLQVVEPLRTSWVAALEATATATLDTRQVG